MNPVAITNEIQLNGPDNVWRPRTAWSQHTPARRDKAAALRAVLLPFLERIDREDRSQAQFETDGRTAYAREFGHPISGSGFRALFKRTLERDGGATPGIALKSILTITTPRLPKVPPVGLLATPLCWTVSTSKTRLTPH
jgi:hypothetical protein